MAPVQISPLYSTTAITHGGRNGRLSLNDSPLN
ncbi:MAG: Ohr subfamily peroxiredoxin, partial [Myxococcaceae bacterium]